MDRKTKEILNRLDEMRLVEWKPGEKVMRMDVHDAIDTVYQLTRSYRPGTVILQGAGRED